MNTVLLKLYSIIKHYLIHFAGPTGPSSGSRQ